MDIVSHMLGGKIWRTHLVEIRIHVLVLRLDSLHLLFLFEQSRFQLCNLILILELGSFELFHSPHELVNFCIPRLGILIWVMHQLKSS